jgi:hypothetical protein
LSFKMEFYFAFERINALRGTGLLVNTVR